MLPHRSGGCPSSSATRQRVVDQCCSPRPGTPGRGARGEGKQDQREGILIRLRIDFELTPLGLVPVVPAPLHYACSAEVLEPPRQAGWRLCKYQSEDRKCPSPPTPLPGVPGRGEIDRCAVALRCLTPRCVQRPTVRSNPDVVLSACEWMTGPEWCWSCSSN